MTLIRTMTLLLIASLLARRLLFNYLIKNAEQTLSLFMQIFNVKHLQKSPQRA